MKNSYSKHLLFLLPLITANATAEETEKLNVILLFSDQHNADVFSYTGHPDVQTPNIDMLVANGITYERAYCQDAVSAPSRNSLFSGLYPRTLGLLDNTHVNTTPLKENVSLQTVFQQNGYATYAFGKRHLYDASDEGWTLHKSSSESESPEENYVKWIEEQGYADEFGKDWAAEFGKYPNGNSLEGTVYPNAPMGTRTSSLTEMYTMEAYSALNTIETIRKHGESKEPFFCYCSFYRPHQPYNPLQSYLDRYDKISWGEGRNNNSSTSMPPTLREPSENLPPFLANQRSNENGIWCLGLAAKDEQLYRDYVTAYYALVEEIDYWVGEIYKELEEQGLAENTIIIYSSDHGDFVGRHGMIEKAATGHNVYEETLRVPLIFSSKGRITSNVKSDELVELIDIYPTLVDMLGLNMPKLKYPLEGLSLKENLTTGKSVDREYVVSENWSQASIITQDYKLAIWLDPGEERTSRDWRSWGNMLFDYKADPNETNNIYTSDLESTTIKELEAYYADFEERVPGVGKVELSLPAGYNQFMCDDFDYPVGNLSDVGGWYINPVGYDTEPLNIIEGSLTYPGYQDESIGNSVLLTDVVNGQDIKKDVPNMPMTDGIIYYSALVNVKESAAYHAHNHFMGVTQYSETGGGAEFIRLYTKQGSSSDKFQFGITRANQNNDSPLYTEQEYDTNTTHLVVMKMQYIDGAKNDEISLFVNPVWSREEPAEPTIVYTTGQDVDLARLVGASALLLRQAGNGTIPASTIQIDDVRIAASWERLFEKNNNSTMNIKPTTQSDMLPYVWSSNSTIHIRANNYVKAEVWSVDGKLLASSTESTIPLDYSGIVIVTIHTTEKVSSVKIVL